MPVGVRHVLLDQRDVADKRLAIGVGEALQRVVVEHVDRLGQPDPQLLPDGTQRHSPFASIHVRRCPLNQRVTLQTTEHPVQVLSSHQQILRQFPHGHSVRRLRPRECPEHGPLRRRNPKLVERSRAHSLQGVRCLEESKEQPIVDLVNNHRLLFISAHTRTISN